VSPPSERAPGENLLEFISRQVTEMRIDVRDVADRLEAHLRADLTAHSEQDLKALALEKDAVALARRVNALEDAAEVTGVHNTEELKGKYYDMKRTLESERATRNKVLLAVASGIVGTVASVIGKKLGWF